MKIHTTENAKSLITVIGTEYAMAKGRAEKGWIKPDRMLGTLLERLNRLAIDNLSLRKFLDDVGHIPENEDADMDLPWSKDPRDPRDVEVAGERCQNDRQSPKDSANKTMKASFGNRGNALSRL